MRTRQLIAEKLERAIFYQDPDFQPGEARKLVFEFPTAVLIILPLADTDEIRVEIHEGKLQQEPGGKEILRELAGHKLNAYWCCENNQGYFDLMLFGFDLIRPSFGILSEGSALRLVDCTMNGAKPVHSGL